MKIYDSKYGQVHQGDCLEVMKTLPDNSIDTMITDPPAGISFMNKKFDHHRGGRGPWVEYFAERFREALRIIKPGGLALVWALPKTSHWTACALEDAGWEIDTKFYHLFGGGWPKGVDISKGIDKNFGCERESEVNPYAQKNTESKPHHNYGRRDAVSFVQPNPVHKLAKKWNGYRTQMKPMCEEWIVCRKPVDKNFVNNALKHGVGGYKIDSCRIEMDLDKERRHDLEPAKLDITKVSGIMGGYNMEKQKSPRYMAKSIQEQFQKGRYPGTVIIDDSVAEALDSRTGFSKSTGRKTNKQSNGLYGKLGNYSNLNDQGGASRYFTRINWEPGDFDFFYGGKATGSEKNEGLGDLDEQDGHKGSPRRDGKKRREIKTKCSHPTVKSLQLMRWICTLSKPPGGGTVLDIFAGSFSTLIAAYQTDRKFIAIELDEQYCKEGLARLAAVMEQKKFDFEE